MYRPLTALFLTTAIAVVLGLPDVALAAQRERPPSRTMIGKYNHVAVMVAKSSPEEGKVLFKRKKEIFGSPAKQVVVRVAPALVETLEWGDRYVVAYTETTRNNVTRSHAPDPLGPKVLDLAVVGPALFEESEALLNVLESSKRSEVDLGRPFVEDLNALVVGSDAALQRFAIVEIYHRKELQHRFTAEDAQVYREQLGSAEQETEARALLFEIFNGLGEEVRGAWLAEEARALLEEADTTLDLASTWPILLKRAIETLEQDGGPADAAVVGRHFASNNPGVAKAALAALTTLAPDQAARRARELLGRPDLHPTTRTAMQGFLESYRKGEIGG